MVQAESHLRHQHGKVPPSPLLRGRKQGTHFIRLQNSFSILVAITRYFPPLPAYHQKASIRLSKTHFQKKTPSPRVSRATLGSFSLVKR